MDNQEILDLITQGKSKATIKTYTTHFNKLTDLIDFNDNINSVIETITNINESISSKLMMLNIYSMVQRLSKDENDKIFKKIVKVRDKLKLEQSKERINNNKTLDPSLPSYNDYKKFVNELYTNDNYRDFIVNYLILNYNVRNGDLFLKITNDKKTLKDTNFNYLYITPTDIYYIRNVYKTEYKYGQKRNRINGKKFRDAVIEYLDDENNKFLFYDKKGEPIEYDSIGTYVKRATLNNVGEGNVVKIVLKYVDTQPNSLNKIKQVSKNRGTDLDTLLRDYNLKTKN